MDDGVKPVIYLIQGRADALHRYADLTARDDVDSLSLTFDRAIDGSLYVPKSTWAEGRNLLLQTALHSGAAYRYFIFLDDDIRFESGDFRAFEALLARYRPAAAVPVFSPKTRNTVLGHRARRSGEFKVWFDAQLCRLGDAQFLALHRDLIADRLVVPLRTEFDPISWWFTSSTQQLLLLNLYPKHFLQFNSVVVANDSHSDYVQREFKELQRQWFGREFRRPIRDPRDYADNPLRYNRLRIGLNNKSPAETLRRLTRLAATAWGTLRYRASPDYRLPPRLIERIFAPESTLQRHGQGADQP